MKIYEVFDDSDKKVGEVHSNQLIYAGNKKIDKFKPAHFEACDDSSKIPLDAFHE